MLYICEFFLPVQATTGSKSVRAPASLATSTTRAVAAWRTESKGTQTNRTHPTSCPATKTERCTPPSVRGTGWGHRWCTTGTNVPVCSRSPRPRGVGDPSARMIPWGRTPIRMETAPCTICVKGAWPRWCSVLTGWCTGMSRINPCVRTPPTCVSPADGNRGTVPARERVQVLVLVFVVMVENPRTTLHTLTDRGVTHWTYLNLSRFHEH